MSTHPVRVGRTAALCAAVLSLGLLGAAPAAAVPTAGVPTKAVGAVAYQLNAKHDGHATDPLFTALPTLQWSKDLVGTVQYPLVVDGTVFVDVSHADSYGTSVSAYDLDTGDLVWGPVNIGGTYGFGALTYDNGRVFGLNFDGKLYAINATTGHVDWSIQLPGQYAFTSPPTARNGVVYTGGAGSGGTVYAVDEATASVKWTASVENGDSSSPAVSRKGVFVSYACEQAYRFSKTGELRWHHDTDCAGGGGRTDVLHHGRVYIRDDAGKQPAVLSQKSGELISNFASAVAPAFAHDTIVTLADGTLRATTLSSDQFLWARADAPYVTAPLIVNGYVIEGDSDGLVHLFELSDGTEQWSGDAGAAISGPDEHNANGLTGLAAAEGHIVVPAGSVLSVFAATG